MLIAAGLALLAIVGHILGGRRWLGRWRWAPETRTAHLFFAFLAILFLWRAWMPGTAVGPLDLYAEHYPWKGIAAAGPRAGHPTLGDVAYQVYPWMLEVQRAFRQGTLPLWSHSQYAGTPVAANMARAVFFPLTWLLIPFSVSQFLAISAALKIYAAALGTFHLARRIGADGAGATLAGVAFAFGGYMNAFLLFPMSNAMALTPWVLLAALGLARQPGARSAAILALTFALQIFAGHPETVLYTGIATLILWAGSRPRQFEGNAAPITSVEGSSPGRPAGTPALPAPIRLLRVWGWGVAALLGANLIAAAQTLPFLELARSSARRAEFARHPQENDVPWSKVAGQAPLLLLPDYHGNPADRDYSGPFDYNALAGYVGLVPWLLVPLAGRRGATATPGWLVALALVAAAFTFRLPVFYDLILKLPIFKEISHHRWMYMITLCLALLAGLAWTRWRRLSPQRGGEVSLRRFTIGTLGLATLLVALSLSHPLPAPETMPVHMAVALAVVGLGSLALLAERRLRGAGSARTSRAFAAGLLALAVADLFAAHQRYLPVVEARWVFPSTPLLSELTARWRPGDRLAGVGTTFRPNAAMAYGRAPGTVFAGFSDIRGDDALKLERYETILGSAGKYHALYFYGLKFPEAPLLDFLGTAWILADPATELSTPGLELVYSGADGKIYRNHEARGLWTLAPSSPRPPAALAEIDAGASSPVRDGTAGEAALGEISPTRLAGTAQITKAAWLLDAHVWYPGWECEVDGRPARLEPALGAFRAVALEPGAHHIVMEYRPAIWRWGFAASLLGLGLAALGLARRPGNASRPGGASEPA